MDRADYIKTYPDETLNKFINIRTQNKKLENKTKFINNDEEVIPADDFLRKCYMLRRKRDEDNAKEIPKSFVMFSELNVPSTKFDAVNYLINKNKLSEKYYEQKKKLIQGFNREERFINYNQLIKDYSSQPQYDNTQYINSYPQQNYISQNPIIETIPTTQYTTSQPEYHSETNNYFK